MRNRLPRVLGGVALIAACLVPAASADGTETLGTPSIPIAAGTGVLAAGVGTEVAQPGTFTFSLPAAPAQLLLYWTGHYSLMLGGAGDDKVYVRNTAAPATTATFGRAAAGASCNFPGPDRKFGNVFTLSEDGIATKITLRMAGKNDASGLSAQYRTMIYDTSGPGGAPGKRLATSAVVSIPESAPAGEVEFPLASKVFLPAGDYFLAIHSGPNSGKACVSQTKPSGDPAAVNYFNVDAFGDGPSSTYGAASTESAAYTSFATYEHPGTEVTGSLIGGPKLFFTSGVDFRFATYRADITGLGIVGSGSTTLQVSGLGFKGRDGLGNDGAGILAIFSDGADTVVAGVRDGQDLAFDPDYFLPAPTEVTAAERQTEWQTFSFAASSTERTGNLSAMAASVEGIASGFGPFRPNRIEVAFGLPGGTGDTTIFNPFGSFSGPEFDAVNLPVTIPAEASQMSVRALSLPDPSDPSVRPASFAWLVASLSLQNPPAGGEGCTPGYWKTHDGSRMPRPGNAWPPTGYSQTQALSTVFSPAGLGTLGSSTLRQALDFKGGPTITHKKKNLLRIGVASLLSAAHPGVSFPMTTAGVIAAINAALLSNNAATMEALQVDLDELNNAGCPLN